MELYMVKFNGTDYQAAEGMFTSRKEAVFFLEEALGMKASDGNVWIDPLEDAKPGYFTIEQYEVEKETDKVYIVKFSVECFSDSIADVFSSRDEAVAYIEQDEELCHTMHNLWEHKELEHEYWQIEEQEVL